MKRRRPCGDSTSANADRYRDAAPSHQGDGGDARDAQSPRQGFFGQHPDCDGRDPVEVHDADDEQQAHQRPAAAEACRAVTQS
jgi:hypothetical protein